MEEGKLALRVVAGTDRLIKSLDYDPQTHRFWAFRAEGGQVMWETSADGTLWTKQLSEPATLEIEAVRVELFAGSYVSVSAPGEVLVDGVKGERAGP